MCEGEKEGAKKRERKPLIDNGIDGVGPDGRKKGKINQMKEGRLVDP